MRNSRARHFALYLIVGTASAGVLATFALRTTHVIHNDTANVIATGIAALGTLLAVTAAFMALDEAAYQARETARLAEERRHDAIRPVIRVLRYGHIDQHIGTREVEFRAHNYGQYPATSIYLVYWIPWDNHDDPWENLTEQYASAVLLPFPAQPAVSVAPPLSGIEVNHDLSVSVNYVIEDSNIPTQSIKGIVDCLYEDILGWWWMNRFSFSVAADKFPGGRQWMDSVQPTHIEPPPWIKGAARPRQAERAD